MSFPITLANRSIKILGNIAKALCYPFHFIFPNKRFTIPTHSDAWVKSDTPSCVTKIIWQTNYTNNVSLPVYLNYLFNRLMSLEYEYRYVSTEERLEFIRENASQEVIDAFEQLTDGAAQADLWRLFVLNFYGGVYMDIDAHLVWPLSKIIEPDMKEVFLLNKEHYTNYFMASAKNNPTIEKTINLIVQNIQNRSIEGGVYSLTGPSVLNEAIGNTKVNHRFYRYTCVQGSFTNEYFQYIDKRRGKWTHANKEDLLKKAEQ